jgi:hypothetical protein
VTPHYCSPNREIKFRYHPNIGKNENFSNSYYGISVFFALENGKLLQQSLQMHENRETQSLYFLFPTNQHPQVISAILQDWKVLEDWHEIFEDLQALFSSFVHYPEI